MCGQSLPSNNCMPVCLKYVEVLQVLVLQL